MRVHLNKYKNLTMRLILIPTFLFLSLFVVNAQNFKKAAQIIDSESGEGLPYANIMVVNHTIGTTSDSQGYFELTLADSLKNDSLIISYVGYQPLRLCLNEFQDKILKLNPTNVKLNEVVIKPSKKKPRVIVINKFNKKDCKVRYYQLERNRNLYIPTRPQEPTIEAICFPYKNEYQNKKIKEVVLRTTSYKKTPTSFNLRLYEGDENGIPSNSLLGKNLIIETTKVTETIRINLEKHQLSVPKNGIFVGFEVLIIDKNKRLLIDSKGNKIASYSPFLNFTREEKEEWFWIYSKGKWTKIKQKAIHDLHNNLIYNKPAISLVLTE